MTKRNVIANYFGQGFTAIMGIAFVPVYIKYLGIEAYGLIGFFAVMQTWLSLLDMGMMPTLSREMALFAGGARSVESLKDLLRSIELVFLGLLAVVLFGIFLSASWFAGSWFKSKNIPLGQLEQVFFIMGIVGVLRFSEGIYRSALIGLQRQVFINIVTSAMAALRGIGAIGVIVWISPSIQAFFIWQGIVSIVTFSLLVIATYRCLPSGDRLGQFSWIELQSVWQFARGMAMIALLSLLLGQMDKVLLSKMISLSDFGEYMLASSVGGGVLLLVGPVTQAYYPRFCKTYGSKNGEEFADAYHESAQLVSIIVGSVAIVLIFYSKSLLELWTGNHELSVRIGPIVSILAFGNLLNGIMTIPYQAQLAHGWTLLSVRMNLIAMMIFLPILMIFVPRYGGVAAALGWATLTIFYLFVGSFLMFRKILNAEKYIWIRYSVIQPIVVGSIFTWIIKLIIPVPAVTLGKVFYFTFIFGVLLSILIAMSPKMRSLIINKKVVV